MSTPTRHTVRLEGCIATPLANYLKALGVFRIVAEQVDPGATAWWEGDCLTLESTLDEPGIIAFFLREYRPTPILAPWNGGCGFYQNWDEKKNGFKSRKATEAVTAIQNATNPSFGPYREQIGRAKKALERFAQEVDVGTEIRNLREKKGKENWSKDRIAKAVKNYLDEYLFFDLDGKQLGIQKADKDEFVRTMRSEELEDQALRWLDAALVLLSEQKEKNRVEAPLLGTGGNIGNSELSERFMQLIAEVLPLDSTGEQPANSANLLRAAVLGKNVLGLGKYAVDQFNPGKAGGANMGPGFEADFLQNPWDYILMLEGALIVTGTVTRRLRALHASSAFPFSVDSAPVGFASVGDDETRGEIWLPLWNRGCSLAELSGLLGEGRAEKGRHSAGNAVEFARAVAALGVDRGIDSFIRIQFQMRLGKNYLASVVGTFDVRYRKDTTLLDEFDGWYKHLRDVCSRTKPKPPSSLKRCFRQLDSSVFSFCQYGKPHSLGSVLVSLGQAERAIIASPRTACDSYLRPLPPLSTHWLDASDDGSPEFRLACSLASIRGKGEGKNSIGPLRSNMVPYDFHRPRAAYDHVWMDKPHVVWQGGALVPNLMAVLRRRCMEAQRIGLPVLPLEGRYPARLDDVLAFINGDVDEQHLEEFLWGLNAIDWKAMDAPDLAANKTPVPPAYALLKLTHATIRPDGSFVTATTPALPYDPGILAAAVGGRCAEATRRAARRLRASGWTPLATVIAGNASHIRRCTAATLFPLRNHDLRTLSYQVLRSAQPRETHENVTATAE